MDWKKPTEITDRVAEDWWEVKNSTGELVVVRVAVGRPVELPNDSGGEREHGN